MPPHFNPCNYATPSEILDCQIEKKLCVKSFYRLIESTSTTIDIRLAGKVRTQTMGKQATATKLADYCGNDKRRTKSTTILTDMTLTLTRVTNLCKICTLSTLIDIRLAGKVRIQTMGKQATATKLADYCGNDKKGTKSTTILTDMTLTLTTVTRFAHSHLTANTE